MVVITMRRCGSARCLDSCRVEVEAFAAPFSNRSYSRCVCQSRSLRSTTNSTLSTPGIREASWAVLNEVRVLPDPVVCHT